jgi:cell division protein FtsL
VVNNNKTIFIIVFLVLLIGLIVYITIFITRKYKNRQLKKKLEELIQANPEGSDYSFENDSYHKFTLRPLKAQ